jgi:hypothetical protein
MKTTAGTTMTESTAMMAPPATIVPEMTAATVAAVMTMVMLMWSLQSSVVSSQAPTSGRLASMYQADRLALGAINPSLVMTFLFFMNEISFYSAICRKADLPRADGNASVLSPTMSI